MKEKYRCAACRRTFATRDAVDGFDQGYRKGFLCPFCNANLKEAGESDEILNLRYGLVYFLAMTALIFIGGSGLFLIRFTENAHINELLTLALLFAVPTIPFLVVNRKSVFTPRTIYTRRIGNR